MSEEVESLSDLALKKLKDEVLEAISETEHAVKNLDDEHPSIYLFLVEIDAYKHVIDMIDRHLQK